MYAYHHCDITWIRLGDIVFIVWPHLASVNHLPRGPPLCSTPIANCKPPWGPDQQRWETSQHHLFNWWCKACCCKACEDEDICMYITCIKYVRTYLIMCKCVSSFLSLIVLYVCLDGCCCCCFADAHRSCHATTTTTNTRHQTNSSLICACLLTLPWEWVWWYDPFYFILCAFHIWDCLFLC